MAQTPLPPAPGVLEVKASYLQSGQVLQNTFHLHKSGTWSPEQIQEAIDVYTAWEDATAKSLRGGGASLNDVRATDLSSPTANYAAEDVNPAIVGTASGQMLPENVTFAVQAGTGKRGRGRQGRVFWIGLTEAMTNGSVMDTTVAGNIITALNTLKDNWNGTAGAAMVTLHRKENGVYINPATWEEIGTFGAADLTTDSQKNRLPNHRRHKRPRTP